MRFFESAGKRGALELVGEELLSLLRSGVAAEQIGIVCPSLERWQAPLETALGTLGVPYALEGYARFDKTPYGQALLSLLRFAWLGGGRGDLYTFLRSPYSSLTRQNVDFLEGRLRGRAVDSPERVEEETIRLRDGQPLPVLEAATLGAVAARRRCRARRLHAARRLRARGAAGRRALASGHSCARGRDAPGRRAAGLE